MIFSSFQTSKKINSHSSRNLQNSHHPRKKEIHAGTRELIWNKRIDPFEREILIARKDRFN